MATAATQTDRQLAVLLRTLQDDALLLTSFRGEERMSRPFTFTLEMLSDDDAIDPRAVVGQRIGWRVRLSDGISHRHFSGHVARFAASDRVAGKRQYVAEVVPWLWFLTQSTDCRVFQGLTVPQILEKVFASYSVAHFDLSELKRTYRKLEYCVQYRETDFNFVSRLMESEGIFYHFKHQGDAHHLVLGDQVGAYKLCLEKEVEQESASSASERADHVLTWSREHSFITSRWTETDYNFITDPARNAATPADHLLTQEPTVKPAWPYQEECKVFDAPGGYTSREEGKVLTKIRMEEQETGYEVVSGTSRCKTFTAGGKFKLTGHESPSEVGRSYVLTMVRHEAHEPADYTTGAISHLDYENAFKCIPDSVIFRPERITPKPLIHGTQTAVVTGPPGEEIWPDKYGRVKVQFFWDTRGKRTEETSCWIRCAQSIAGKNWGAMVLPRVGQEVVVSYLEGDPDRPLITGAVYNDDQMPPYTLPENKTRTTLKTSSSPGGDGFNELRFEDKKSQEQIFLHAQRNLDVRVRNQSIERVVGSRHLIVGYQEEGANLGKQTERVFGDKYLNVKGTQEEQLEGNFNLTIGKGDDPDGGHFDLTIAKRKTERVEGGVMYSVVGDRSESVAGKYSLFADSHVEIIEKHLILASEKTSIHGYSEMVLSSPKLTLSSGGNYITIDSTGITIKGALVLINSGGSPAGQADLPATGEIEEPLQALWDDPIHADNAKPGKKSAPDALH